MAITFDNSILSTATSFSFTCSGNALVLASYSSQAYTYGGQALTLVSSSASGHSEYIYVLLNPPTGSNNISNTAGATVTVASYSGVDSVNATSGANSGFTTVTSIANSITTTATGEWVVAGASVASTNGVAFTGTPLTTRQGSSIGQIGQAIYDSNGPVSVGTLNYTAAWSGATQVAATAAISLRPKSSAGFLSFM